MNIRELFDERGVQYTLKSQVTRGNLGLTCPLCEEAGDPDPSMHLGIDPKTGAWSCWRNPKHRGRAPHYLLWRLLRMPSAEVDRLLEFQNKKPVPAKTELTANAQKQWDLMVDMKSPLADAHRRYLYSRGVDDKTIARFGLRAGVVGAWAGRVVFPIYDSATGTKRSWVGRSIGNATPKYRALGRDDGPPLSTLLFNAERLFVPAHSLIICEGPFDVVVLQSLIKYSTIIATVGINVSDTQAAQIAASTFDRKRFLYDSTALPQALVAARKCGAGVINYRAVFGRHGDPGDLTEADKPALEKIGLI